MAVDPVAPPHRDQSGAPGDCGADWVARIAKALAHPARVRIVATLLQRRTCIGCDIVEEIGLAASTTSEHLRILKSAGLVIGRIEPPRVCYSLDPGAVAPLSDFLETIAAASPPSLPE